MSLRHITVTMDMKTLMHAGSASHLYYIIIIIYIAGGNLKVTPLFTRDRHTHKQNHTTLCRYITPTQTSYLFSDPAHPKIVAIGL